MIKGKYDDALADRVAAEGTLVEVPELHMERHFIDGALGSECTYYMAYREQSVPEVLLSATVHTVTPRDRVVPSLVILRPTFARYAPHVKTLIPQVLDIALLVHHRRRVTPAAEVCQSAEGVWRLKHTYFFVTAGECAPLGAYSIWASSRPSDREAESPLLGAPTSQT